MAEPRRRGRPRPVRAAQRIALGVARVDFKRAVGLYQVRDRNALSTSRFRPAGDRRWLLRGPATRLFAPMLRRARDRRQQIRSNPTPRPRLRTGRALHRLQRSLGRVQSRAGRCPVPRNCSSRVGMRESLATAQDVFVGRKVFGGFCEGALAARSGSALPPPRRRRAWRCRLARQRFPRLRRRRLRTRRVRPVAASINSALTRPIAGAADAARRAGSARRAGARSRPAAGFDP